MKKEPVINYIMHSNLTDKELEKLNKIHARKLRMKKVSCQEIFNLTRGGEDETRN
jgi:hypothetical protein